MADEKPEGPRYKGLIPAKPGERRNPQGISQYTRFRKRFVAFAEGMDDSNGYARNTRHQVACRMLYEGVMDKDPLCLKLWFEQLQGKAGSPKSPEDSKMALANHFRQVAKDAAEIVLAALGSRKDTMKPEDVSQFIASVSVNTAAYLEQAERMMGDVEPERPTLAASPPAARPEVPPSDENEAMPPEAGVISDGDE